MHDGYIVTTLHQHVYNYSTILSSGYIANYHMLSKFLIMQSAELFLLFMQADTIVTPKPYSYRLLFCVWVIIPCAHRRHMCTHAITNHYCDDQESHDDKYQAGNFHMQ